MILLILACARAPLPGPPSSGPARAELITMVLVDRFANGDAGNDRASPGPGPDPSDPQAWHGGDLRGVIDHLDLLAATGTTQLWISPVFGTRTEPIGVWGAYHGYWQWDPLTVEPRFGSEGDLRELVGEARKRGMGLMLDLVTNHVGYEASLLQQHPDWFHDEPSIKDWSDRAQLERGQVHGLPDLAQEQPEVRAWLHEVARTWQERLPLSGYRVDAVRHVPNDFFAELGSAIRGRGAAWFLGEDFTGDPVELSQSQASGGFSHVFDFPLHYAMVEVFCDDASPARLGAVLSLDRLYERPDGLVPFLDNHDLPRILSRCHGDEDRVRRALAFMFAVRGVPSLTYGTEAGLKGEEEPHNRASMVFGPAPLREEIAALSAWRGRAPLGPGGEQEVVELGPDTLVLLRRQGREALLTAVNRGENEAAVRPWEGELLEAWTSGAGAAVFAAEAEWKVPGRSVRTWRLRLEEEPAPATEVELRVELRGAPPGELRLVGSDPMLGAWKAEAGLPLVCEGDTCSATVRAPRGTIVEGKPILVQPDGAVRWAEGANRAALLGEDSVWTLNW